MKELKLFQCEICGAQYANKTDAKNCEESHKVPKKISGCKYLYPQKISIIFDDGKTVDYHR